jgi:hypothetical protein
MHRGANPDDGRWFPLPAYVVSDQLSLGASGGGELSKMELQPLVDKNVDKLPPWKGQIMNQSGRLALIKTMLMVMTTYVTICIRLPPRMHKAMEKIMKAFLWTLMRCGGGCLLAWRKVQRSMRLDDLGILDLRLFGSALRL